MNGCAVVNCTGKHHANGLCQWHVRNPPDPASLQRTKKEKRARRKIERIKQPVPVVKHRGRPCCDTCGARDPRKSYRLDRNLRPDYALLCKPCRVKLGYREVSYERPYAELAARSIMRGAA